MTSHLLAEGVLDVKDPKGSGDRKFWRAWRRQWISFSVVYPPGRLEPFLLLNISQDSTSSSEKEIKLVRDGLRFFRCRSRSRPYNSWAIASGNKVVLYLAAETEVQTQNWMQLVRDGLWPPCFSFQMLTACSHEVSIIDDDDTFLAGLLGVYGRFVQTSADMISLMHPHWGSTLLEISLDNISDVVLVREAEVPPTGVFSILLKRKEISKVKALQFFSKTTKDAIQWILSKTYTRRKSLCAINNVKPEDNLPHSILIQANFEKNTSLAGCINEKAFPLNTNQSKSLEGTVTQYIINSSPEYENLISLNMKRIGIAPKLFENNRKLVSQSDAIEKDSKESLIEQLSTKMLDAKELSTDVETMEKNHQQNFDVNYSNKADDSQTTATNYRKLSSILIPDFCDDQVLTMPSKSNFVDKTHESSTLSVNDAKTNPLIYATVDKSYMSKTSSEPTLEKQFSNSKNCESQVLETNRQHEEFLSNSIEKVTDVTPDYMPVMNSKVLFHNDIKHDQIKEPSDSIEINDFNFPQNNYLTSQLCDKINEGFPNDVDLSQHSTKKFLKDDMISEVNQFHILTSLSSEFLDTSLNLTKHKNKAPSRSSSLEENTENLLWLLDEATEKDTTECIYEDILDRKGTIYEEIDTSDDEYVTQSPVAPKLPNRPQNLEIPESLHLQKLSKNITQTLQVIKNTEPLKKEQPHFSFIKKIKDVNRIMKISSDHEKAKESFTVESKLPIEPERMSVLKPIL